MKRLISAVLALAFVCVFPHSAKAAEQPAPNAEAYALYCVENGSMLLAKDEDRRMKPASTTKLMTALLTLEEAAKNDRAVTFTQEMTAEGSSMYLKIGERLRLSDLAAGMLMCSGNDAANAAALSLSESFKGFANLMNARARKIGMTHTHFVTPSGLDDVEHYSSAHDLALLMAECLRNEAFAGLTCQKSAAVRFIEPADKTVVYNNHNRLLQLYKHCIGGKTGYTTEAGRTLVSAARRNGVTLICVTLNDKTDWDDHMALYDYGFARFGCYRRSDSRLRLSVHCVGGESGAVTVTGEADVSLVVESGRESEIVRTVMLDPFVYAPVKRGERLGMVVYSLNKKTLKSVALIAAEDVGAKRVKKNIFRKIKELFTYG